MTLRIEPITRLPLIQKGAACPADKFSALEVRLLSDLHDDVPILRYLRASVVTTHYEVDAGRLWLVVLLEESPQIPIAFVNTNAGRLVRNADQFLEDLKGVREQMEKVEGRILMTISGIASPLDGSQDTPQASSTATMRRRIKRGVKNGVVIVPSLPHARQMLLVDLPRTLPQGPHVTITALVKSIDNMSAQLLSVHVEEAIGFENTFKVSSSKTIRLERVGPFQRVEAGSRLQRAMDSHSRVRLSVVAALTWDSGDVAHFELTGFPEEPYSFT